jgi:predicted dehydrogenase
MCALGGSYIAEARRYRRWGRSCGRRPWLGTYPGAVGIRWGVLSTAAIGLNKVIPGMQAAQDCEVVAIASRDPDTAAEAAGRLGVPRSFGSYEALLADPDIDAVYVPLPNHLHAEWTLRAAAAGKHVLCEKPLAMNETQAREMVEGCRGAGVKLMEAFMYRLHPQWVRVREIVAQGRLGDVLAVQSFFSYRNLDPQNIRNVPAYGGGALMDIGCYAINVSRMLFGSEPTAVQGALYRDPRFGTDVLSSATLDFGGRQATFTCSTQLEPDQRVHIVGTQGRLSVEIPFNIPPDRATRLLLTAGGEPPVDPHTEVIEVPAANQYGIQGTLFARAVLDDTEVPVTPEDSIANMRVIDALRSGATGRT